MKIPTADLGFTIDDKLHNIVLGMTLGQLNSYCENAQLVSTEKYWLSHTIRDAIALMDIRQIQTVIQRLDGGVPTKENRDKYANYLGSFLEDVSKLPVYETKQLRLEDPVYLCLAKAIYHISLMNPQNPQQQRDKNTATEIIFDRCGGRVSEPVKELVDVTYTQPKWMKKSLPESKEPSVSIQEEEAEGS